MLSVVVESSVTSFSTGRARSKAVSSSSFPSSSSSSSPLSAVEEAGGVSARGGEGEPAVRLFFAGPGDALLEDLALEAICTEERFLVFAESEDSLIE
jgi:hypothetical protein